jgi:hypothetical protein
MGPVDPQSVNEMKRLMEMFGGAINAAPQADLPSGFEAPPTFEYDIPEGLEGYVTGGYDSLPASQVPQYAPPAPASIPSVPVTTSEADHMKSILTRFYEATNSSVERIQERAETNPRLKEALATKKTPKGVQVGSWEIRVHEDGPNTKTYDVVNVHTNEPIAHDLSLYESALSLTKMLNKNVGINNPRIHEILRLEDEFTRQRTDASTFKRKINRMIKEGDEFRAHIAEDRYNECKTQAVSLRNQLIIICKSL